MVQPIGNRVIQRRTFIAIISGSVLASPLAADAQPAGKVPRVGYVTSSARSVNVDAFDQGLRDLGHRIGQDIIVEYRFAEGRIDRLPALLPIVGVDLETDPVVAGWVKNLARPGGNITGFFLDLPELSGKLIQFLTEVVPRRQRVAVLWDAVVGASQFFPCVSA
jgi:putative ABC transport system substrate-binding protein